MTTQSPPTLSLTQPDDWHIHLRDGAELSRTVNDAARQFNRVIVMPNLQPPVTTAAQAEKYHDAILSALLPGRSLHALMTLYLTDNTSPKIVREAKQSGMVRAFKWYPAGATTNSASGVTSAKAIYPALEAMQEEDIVLTVHGEVTDSSIDIFDREAIFIDTILKKIVRDFPRLRVVLEHITTAQAVEFVSKSKKNVAATITAHHLLYNRNHLLAGGIRPHYYCLPVLKRASHQQALIDAAVSGNPKFFLGTDSAPHSKEDKESACGCAGAYTAYNAIELYASAFEQANALDKLEAFASFYGPDFYQLPRNTNQITLKRAPCDVPKQLPMGSSTVVPLCAGETLPWQLLAS
jgi:dihydroorotase